MRILSLKNYGPTHDVGALTGVVSDHQSSPDVRCPGYDTSGPGGCVCVLGLCGDFCVCHGLCHVRGQLLYMDWSKDVIPFLFLLFCSEKHSS